LGSDGLHFLQVRDAFSRAVIDAVRRAFPDAFEDGEIAA
jgi:hypothetical protein